MSFRFSFFFFSFNFEVITWPINASVPKSFFMHSSISIFLFLDGSRYFPGLIQRKSIYVNCLTHTHTHALSLSCSWYDFQIIWIIKKTKSIIKNNHGIQIELCSVRNLEDYSAESYAVWRTLRGVQCPEIYAVLSTMRSTVSRKLCSAKWLSKIYVVALWKICHIK